MKNLEESQFRKTTTNKLAKIGLELGAEKYQDIISSLPKDLQNPNQLFDSVITSFLSFSTTSNLPEKKAIVTMFNKGIDGGKSEKIKNIFLNWRGLFSAIPSIVIATTATTVGFWVIPFVALHIWNVLTAQSRVLITPEHATTFYTIWEHYLIYGLISIKKTFQLTNEHRSSNGLQKLTEDQFKQTIKALERMECISIENGLIRPIEWARCD